MLEVKATAVVLFDMKPKPLFGCKIFIGFKQELSEDEEYGSSSASPHIKFKRTNEVRDESHMIELPEVDVNFAEVEPGE